MRKFIEQSWLILTLGVVFAVLLAGAQTSLAPRIDANLTRALNEAIGQVVPGVAKTESLMVPGYDRAVYKCLGRDGQLVGWAIDASGAGFADKIRLVAGLSPDTTRITGLKVIENVETPGLGNKIADESWARQFRGLEADRRVAVQKRPPAAERNEVQAITGATISSRAVADIVSDALDRVRPGLAGLR